MRRKAFTLIELMVAIAIIIILAVIIVHRAYKAIEKATITAIIRDIHSIKSAAMVFYADTGTWPADRCNAAFTSNTNCTYRGTYPGWDGPYLEKWPMAKWGHWFFPRSVVGYRWINDTFLGCGVLELLFIPPAYAQKIDLEIDGVIDRDAGSVTYRRSNPAIVRVLICSR